MLVHNETRPIIPKTSWADELKWFLKNSLPISGYYVLLLSSRMAGVMVLGHLGTTELAASALGTVFASMTAFSVTYGAISALDTLCSQAWTGAHNRALLGAHIQRAVVILGSMYIIIAVLWLNATSLFRMIGQDDQIAHYAAQGIMSASTLVQMVVVPISWGLVYILTYHTSFHFRGVPLASSVTFWLMLLGLLAYTRYIRGSEAWGGWSLRTSLTDWPIFFRYALPGMVNTLAEWWCFELVSLGASYLGQAPLAAQSILMCLDDMTSTLGWGISTAAAIRVGHRIGHSMHPHRTIYTACGLALIFGILATLVVWLLRLQLARLFSSDVEIIAMVTNIIPSFTTYLVAKTVANTLTGVLRGIGRPDVTARINVPAYYGVGFPLAYWAGLKVGWGLAGFWSGLCCATMLAATGHVAYLAWFVDWDHVTQKTRDRIEAEEENI
ncbi:mate-domain-containing protein [Dichotomocladium elegans]|nr:mate-domain-containing protein [Dichotomocladium elegans]